MPDLLTRVTGWIFISAAGLVIVVFAPHVGGDLREYPGFMPWIRAGVEGASWATLAGLAALGFLTGYLGLEKARWIGCFSVALLPLWASVEMMLDPKSHNLWPLEFMIYGFWGFVAGGSARIGKRLRGSETV